MQFFQRILLVACTVALFGTSTAQPSLSIRTTAAVSTCSILFSASLSAFAIHQKRRKRCDFPIRGVRHRGNARLASGVDVACTGKPGAARNDTAARARFRPGRRHDRNIRLNELTAAGTSPLPGVYTIRAHLLDRTASPDAVQTVRFVEPLPVSAIAKLRIGDEVTVAGVVDASQQTLADSTGTLPLSKRLIGATFVRLAVRGSIAARPDGSRYLAVERWAPLAPPRDQDARSRS